MGQRSGYTSSGTTGLSKANKFAEAVKPHEWECKVSEDPATQTVHLFARRGTADSGAATETIDIWWIGPKGALTAGKLPKYTLAGEQFRCHNVSAVIAIASNEPDMSKLGKSVKRTARKLAAPKTANAIGASATRGCTDDENADGLRPSLEAIHAAVAMLGLAIDPSEPAIRARLTGRWISWINTQSGLVHSARVDTIEKVVQGQRPHVCFVDKKFGFHAVYLSSIVEA